MRSPQLVGLSWVGLGSQLVLGLPTCTLTLWSPVKVVFPTWQEKSISISIGISIGIFCFVSLWAGPLLTSSELTKKLWHSENFGIWSKVNKTQKYLFHENRTWETDCPADGGHHQAVVHPGLLEPGGVRVYSSSNLAVLLSYLTKVRCRGRLWPLVECMYNYDHHFNLCFTLVQPCSLPNLQPFQGLD